MTRMASTPTNAGITDGTLLDILTAMVVDPRYKPPPGKVFVRTVDYYHAIDYPQAGTNLLSYFTATESLGVTNWPGGQQGLPNDQPFICDGVRINPLCGVNTASAADAESTTFDFDTASETAISLAPDFLALLDRVMKCGLLEMTISNRQIISPTRDLRRFPQAGGLFIQSSMVSHDAGTSATAAAVIANVTNGQPVVGNEWRFRQPVIVMPGKPVRVNLRWPTVVALPTNASFAMQVELFGRAVEPANL
jgi:hypothetical protein